MAGEPKPEDFGLTESEVSRIRSGDHGVGPLALILGGTLSFVVWYNDGFAGMDAGAAFWTVVGCFLFGAMGAAILNWFAEQADSSSDPRYQAYMRALHEFEDQRRAAEVERRKQEAQRAYEEAVRRRKREEYWLSLSAYECEVEVKAFFERKGFKAQLTPRTGDHGIDILLEKNGKSAIVQCKAHKAAIGPAVIRDLYGTLTHGGHAFAYCVATSTYTFGAREFARTFGYAAPS